MIEDLTSTEEVPAEAESDVDEPEPEELVLTKEDARTLIFPVIFESTRADNIELFEWHFTTSSLNSYTYDESSGTVVLDVTSAPEFDYELGLRESAYQLMGLFAGGHYSVAGADDWLLEDPRWAPNVRVTVSSVTYECDEQALRDLGKVERSLSFSDFETRCLVR